MKIWRKKNYNKICTFFMSIQVYLCLGKIICNFKKIREINWFPFILHFTDMYYMEIYKLPYSCSTSIVYTLRFDMAFEILVEGRGI